MIHFIKTSSKNIDFISLVKQLDAELTIKDGDDHDFYHQFNGITNLNYVIVAYKGQNAIGCGSIKSFDKKTMEIKRMFVPENARGLGIATQILTNLESWASDLGYSKCILETGKILVEAIALYKKCGYQMIPNYGQYKDVENSVCFEKQL
ncbi:MAG: putative acetyltransferase [Glaciecola sp.]|jgi:putative acetyltransferase